jgi:hypothetical protein
MKHILNNISEKEKQKILEQHSGGTTINNKMFFRLVESKLGDVKPLLSEQIEANAGAIQQFLKTNQDPNLVVDYAFGNGSAAAAGKYISRGSNDKNYDTVTTVQKLWELMKADNLDVGTTPGFGPKMATALAGLLDRMKGKIDTWVASQKNAGSKPKVITGCDNIINTIYNSVTKTAAPLQVNVFQQLYNKQKSNFQKCSPYISRELSSRNYLSQTAFIQAVLKDPATFKAALNKK